MTSKYQEAIGKWEHTIGKITHVITPEEDDNYKFLRIKQEAQKTNSDETLFKGVGDLYFEMVLRSDKALSEEDQKWLKKWISINVSQIVKDFLIAFRWTTPEQLAKVESDQKKNLNESI